MTSWRRRAPSPSATEALVATLGLVVQAARQQGRPVVWVTSVYGETPAGATPTSVAPAVQRCTGVVMVLRPAA